MSFWGTFLPNVLTAGLEIAAAALGGSTSVQRDTLNKGWNGRIYGSEWPRCRGRVRLPGVPIWATPIITTVWKTTSGGIFGIGQHSAYYNRYSISLMYGFGKKLGHGSAIRFLRLWADNKLLFNGVASSAAVVFDNTDPYSVSFATNQNAGASSVVIHLNSSGASINCDVGDLVVFNQYPGVTYEVQNAIDATGPGNVTLSFWPPLANELLQTNATLGQDPSPVISFPGATASPWDLSSFDPNPHDGSHPTMQPPPTGYVTFYLGDDAQEPDPLLVQNLGVGNVPGFRSLVCALLAYLELANYGNHPPRIEAEIEYDAASDAFLDIGPYTGVTMTSGPNSDQFLVPTVPASATYFQDPTSLLPYMWAIANNGTTTTIYKVNTQTNQLVGKMTVGTPLGSGSFTVGFDGSLYIKVAVSGGVQLLKIDGQALSVSLEYGSGIPFDLGLGFDTPIITWKVQASLFGNAVVCNLVAMLDQGDHILFMDAYALLPYGVADSLGSYSVIQFLDSKGSTGGIVADITGSSSVVLGDITSRIPLPHLFAFGANPPTCVDGAGNLWMYDSASNGIWKFDCQYHSGVYIDQFFTPHQVLYPPSFAMTTYVGPNGGGGIWYFAGDNSIIIVASTGVFKYSASTGQLMNSTGPQSGWSPGPPFAISSVVDGLGTILVHVGATVWRISAASLAVLNSYNLADWLPGFSNGPMTYDPILDAVWTEVNSSGGLYRLFLDRSNPSSGVGLDNVVGTVMTEAGYSPTLYSSSSLSLISVGGIQVPRQPHKATMDKLMELYQFTAAETNGEILFLPRPQTPVLTIPESDLGAVVDPAKKEFRLQEIITEELTVPLSVWIHYSDFGRFDQESAQYAKRNSKPYSTTLSAYQFVTNSIEKYDLMVPIYANGPDMKQRAKWILWEKWSGRYQRSFKTGGLKYVRLDPSDVVYVQKGSGQFEQRLTVVDRGAGYHLQFESVEQDETVYTPSTTSTSNLSSGGPGGSGNPTTGSDHGNYTINPANPITQVSTTQLALGVASDGVTATFDDGTQTYYNPRPAIPIADPGSGNTQIYYITFYDPNFTGEQPGTNSLTMLVSKTPAGAHVGETGYINMGSYNAAGAGAIGGGTGGSGGQPPPSQGEFVGEVAFGPTTRGPNQVAHGLGSKPATVVIQVTTPGGEVVFQPQRYDSTFVYLDASDDNLYGYLELYQ